MKKGYTWCQKQLNNNLLIVSVASFLSKYFSTLCTMHDILKIAFFSYTKYSVIDLYVYNSMYVCMSVCW